MRTLSPVRTRLIAAGVLLAGLIGATTLTGLSAAAMSRILLGVAALAGIAWWTAQRARPRFGAVAAQRLIIQQRVGLSPRCGLALVTVDGNEVLVAYGDSFAELHPVASPAPLARGRRPVRKARVPRRAVNQAGGRS